jgi:acetyltransferase-like isoleucine patch superfamily enzyme
LSQVLVKELKLIKTDRKIMMFKRRKKSLRDIYPQYQIGRFTYGKPDIHSWGEGATLEIGSFTSIAAGVQIFLGGGSSG